MDLVEFLTSKEIIVVYIVALAACFLCFIIYLVEKNNIKVRQRHNTRELNKIVEEIKEETVTEEPEIIYEEPVLEVIEEVKQPAVVEEIKEEPVIQEVKEELQYTSIEPDQETAQLELTKITEELKRQEELETEDNNSILNSYEQEQEENAIISLEELVKKSKDMYQANELREYSEEGNEPITLQELEAKTGFKASEVTENFVIENVVDDDLEQPVVEEVKEIKQVSLDDFNTIKTAPIKEEEVKRFHSSPIISPIYGIERKEISNNELELENTANYEKLDQEIKKTNEFLMTLKDLQKKLD